jgi:hypothetical protein
MTADHSGPGLRQSGSRGFVLPLLLTVVGVLASVALYLTVAGPRAAHRKVPATTVQTSAGMY